MPHSIITVSTQAPGGIRSVVENYQQSDVFEGYEAHWLAAHREGSVIYRCGLFLSCLVQLLWLRLRGHRLYHLHMAMKGSFYRKSIILFLLKLSRARVILHLHGSEFDQYHETASTLVKWLMRRTLLAADVVVVLSRRWQDTVAEIDSTIRSQLIYNYVEPVPEIALSGSLLQHRNTPGTVRYVYMGEVGQRKGIYDLLPAFAELCRVQDNVELIVCGSGEIEAASALARKCGVADKVTFVGWISGDDKYAMLGSADVLVLPSYHEGLPMAILEAMSLGKCVVSSTVGGIPEIIASGENGLLHRPGDVATLVELLGRAADAEIRGELGRQGRSSYYERFTPNSIVPQIRKLYHELA
ncbi:glycosyltransferase family 4 protein [Parahaliea maris]|uniref:Glycosyltransferase family 4 protein n=1 Tax=Parahaliea maris TaxID=2716870 RepID=A0A5C8ZQX4_9GAMM|nr:glycosyltransferase family 4 protein [Parahaliea maris]TXS89897.1 glycosyltransferase family 4 protein [Parahaliea maris]